MTRQRQRTGKAATGKVREVQVAEHAADGECDQALGDKDSSQAACIAVENARQAPGCRHQAGSQQGLARRFVAAFAVHDQKGELQRAQPGGAEPGVAPARRHGCRIPHS